MKKRYLSLIVSLALLAALIYFSDVGKIAAVLSKTELSWILFGLFITLAGWIIRTFRWKILLDKIKFSPPFFELAKVYVAGMFISNISPGKTGDPIRSIILKKAAGVNVSSTLPSIFFERIFDVITTIAISLLGLLFLREFFSQIYFWVVAAMAVYLTAFSVGIFIISSKKRTTAFFSKILLLSKFMPRIKKFSRRIKKFSSNIHNSFVKYKDIKILALTTALSTIVWLLEGSILFVSFKSLGLDVSLLSTIIIVPIAALLSILTFLPGGLGSAEIITVLFFTTLYPLTLAEVTAAALIARFLSFWMYVFFGSFLLSTMKYKYTL